jgi:RNA polymerase sigma factor (sigma-70 family)
MAREYWANNESQLDDLVAEGMIGVMHAFEKFDPARGVRFLSYATHHARNAMQTYCVRERNVLGSPALSAGGGKQVQSARKKRHAAGASVDAQSIAAEYGMPVARAQALLDLFDSWLTAKRDTLDLIPSDELNPEEQYAEKEQASVRLDQLAECLDELAPRDRAIIAARYLDKDGERTLDEVGKMFGSVSRERIRQIEARAMAKMRKAAA